MSDRYTKSHVASAFERLCKLLGHRIAKDCKDVGAWRLDYNPSYGGSNVEQIITEGGGVRQPFGSYRLSNREFYNCVGFLSDALREDSRGKALRLTVAGALDRLTAWRDNAELMLRQCAPADEPQWRNQAANYGALIDDLTRCLEPYGDYKRAR